MRSTFETTFSRNFFAGAAPTIPADTVRLARLADLHHVLDLVERSSLAPGCGADEPRLVRAAPDTGIDSVGTAVRNGTCYVAESDGRVIGVCAWVDRNGAAGAEGPRSRTSDTTARVVALAVDATHPPLALARLLVE